jgi:hypothetical protein
VQRLRAAGYVVEQGARYRLKPAGNTGPLAPSILRVSFLWDPNLRAQVGGDHLAEELA